MRGKRIVTNENPKQSHFLGCTHAARDHELSWVVSHQPLCCGKGCGNIQKRFSHHPNGPPHSKHISNPSCPDFPVASGKGASLVAIKARRAELNRNVGSRILCFDTRCHRFVVSRCEDHGWGEAPDGSESVRTYFERVRFLPATS